MPKVKRWTLYDWLLQRLTRTEFLADHLCPARNRRHPAAENSPSQKGMGESDKEI
jgi:hypothetical protein